MNLDTTRFQHLLAQFKLPQLFNELGWDQPTLKAQSISASGQDFILTPIAHKRGVAVLRCSPDAQGRIPPRPVLLKIEQETRKIAHEHLLVFADAGETTLTWLWVLRAPGQPTSTRTHTWHQGQSGEALRQKLSQIVWSLEEEEAITLTDVVTGLRKAFDRDRVSKTFYDKFKAQHDAFAAFITGLNQTADRAWYASLMLNRLMFVYFIQKKGFLDGDDNYLQHRMAQVQQTRGKGHFHSFYRQFLRRLFHEGLGQPQPRSAALNDLIGSNIPYLNGGLFDVHELEANNQGIDVPDEAFEKLFAFFDAWDWHLDDRPLKTGTEINPDVLGYIFEKYINQKQMGAYYTKEDITEYISKNTVIPHLLGQARERCKVAFEGESSVWKLLQTEPDRYIYPAMKTGVIDASGQPVPESALPDFVQTGMHDAKARMFERRYNLGEATFTTATGERGTLPTETWREYVDRRSRCLAVRSKLANGEVQSADDLITLNLDIRQFMQDVIDTSTGPQLLRAVWQAIVGRVPEKSNEKFRNGITILDPTCGSGAFLFAALGILEPLYEACLDRMDSFVEDAKKLGKPAEADFEKVLAEVGKHPSRRYYIYKSIILHNLFGVDIMAEAVEICKLRLFLKLVSQVDKGQQLEPLPDIDFNIRAGNTLVGYATEAQFDASGDLASDQQRKASIKADIADLADLFTRFREQQIVHGGKVTTADKQALRSRLGSLNLELDKYLARDYGIDPDKTKAFADWRASHQPFHWFAQFYGVMREGGFDVVIGNPPYIEYSKVREEYSIRNLETAACGNLWAFCIEKSFELLSPASHFGMIVPVSIVCTQRMSDVQDVISEQSSATWFSNYAERPSKLFSGAEVLLTIAISHKSHVNRCHTFSTSLRKWPSEFRAHLFNTTEYLHAGDRLRNYIMPKISSELEVEAIPKIMSKLGTLAEVFTSRSDHKIFYRIGGGRYWKIFTTFQPQFILNGKPSVSSREAYLYFDSKDERDIAVSLLSSTLFYWNFMLTTNGRDLNPVDLRSFPVSPKKLSTDARKNLIGLSSDLMKSYRKHKETKEKTSKSTGQLVYEEFYPRLSKDVIDEIDRVIYSELGLSVEQQDFLLNFEVKYRMGGTSDDE
ncbi:MAG: Eco57I restriction-modification methylase domain-containing protein [Comamonadaceae bacterium]|nr:Eco57I restriction-modification methylase domain-containing protein [Burkholderiales bacterium]MEB2347458.1 Eco57I restriction-modification methylase domain-containing protein [Comamonadaceae bacterium]